MAIFCSQCGVAVADGSKFCFKCGDVIGKGIPTNQQAFTPDAVVLSQAPRSAPTFPMPPTTTPQPPQYPMPEPGPDYDQEGAAETLAWQKHREKQRRPLELPPKQETLSPAERVKSIFDTRPYSSVWWPIFAAFAFFLCAAILQATRQNSTGSIGEKIIIVLLVAVFYTVIAAFFIRKKHKDTILTPWEIEARRVKADWYLFVVVSLSCLSSIVLLFSQTKDSQTIVGSIIILGIVFSFGFAAWKGHRWAIVALFVWEFIEVSLGSGKMEPLGLFIVLFSVSAFRYQSADKALSKTKSPDLLGALTGFTRMTYAAGQGHLYFAKKLAKSGVNINERTKTGFTPLMLAAHNDKRDFVKWLVKLGADKSVQSSGGKTALELARERGLGKVVKMLA